LPMSKLAVCDMKGTAVGEFEIADERLVLRKGEQAVKDVVTAYRNAIRAGTASTLGKGDVAGSNKKPWRQKGTGQARSGYRQSPIWRGGGVAFGPKPRSYAQKINRKVARLAFQRALSQKISDGQVRVLESLDIPEPKTKVVTGLLKAMGVTGSVLVVVDAVSPEIALACRNLPRLSLATASEVNVYELLQHSTVVATRQAMKDLEARLGGGAGKAE